jgi:HK97 family phage major capsid protein
MLSRTMQVPLADLQTAPSTGDTAWFGGAVCRWTEEAANLNETEPKFRQLELVAHELSGYSVISRSLIQDGELSALETMLHKLVSGSLAWSADLACLTGNGAGQPLGVSNAPCAISVTRQNANQISLQDCGLMLSKLWPIYDPLRTCWVCHPSTLKFQSQLAASGFGTALPIEHRDGKYLLLGLPVATFDGLPTLGTSKDFLLTDFQAYVVGERGDPVIAYSEHAPSQFQRNQGVMRFVDRIDGQPMIGGPITLSDGSTASPFVYLT